MQNDNVKSKDSISGDRGINIEYDLGVTIEREAKHLKELFDTKISSIESRIDKIESGELRRQDRIFKWTTILVSLFISFILGILSTLLIQYFF